MRVEVFVESHERDDAIEAYKDFLSHDQIEMIEEYEGRLKLDIDMRLGHTRIEKL